MNANPFATFNLDIPNKYSSFVKSYSRTGGNKNTPEYAPFKRQVDFWYAAFLVGVSQDLEPEVERDTYNATPGTIFSSDPFRINHMLLAYLGKVQDLEKLSDYRCAFDYCLGVANAGMPHLIQILSEEGQPMWSLFDEFEKLSSKPLPD